MSKKLVEEKQSKQGRSNYEGQERESLRPATSQAALAEKVRDVVEDKTVLNKARQARYNATGEPSRAPNHDDAVRERAVTASKGSKSSKK
jgi:hypothetical protein